MINIKIIEDGKIPQYQTSGSVGADCYARIDDMIPAKSIKTVPLGFAVEIPAGYEMQIRPRSGLASKSGVYAILGTIDSDYRGEVGAILCNNTNEDFKINKGDRIAQAVIAPVIIAKWNKVEDLSKTERGEKGFGSTGVSWDHEISSIFEPFVTISEAEKTLGKEVVIDNSIPAFVSVIVERKTVIGRKSHIIFKRYDNDENIEMDLPAAYMRVKLNDHRFGKEMNFESN